jgi:autotransporter-associated beta strand protein
VIDTGYSGITTLTLNPQGTQSQSYSGVIADGAAGMNLVKSGSGTQTFTNAQTYTGSTTVGAGTLALSGDGAISSSSNFIVNGTLNVSAITPASFTVGAGKALSGTGTVNATGRTLSIEGTHAVGNNNVGQQSISGTASYAAGSIFEWQLGSNVENGTWDHDNDVGSAEINTRGTAFDAVNITGDLNIDGTESTGTVFKIILGTVFDGGDAFWLANRSWDVFTATTSTTAFTNFELYNSGDLVNQVSYDTFGSFSYGFTGGTGTLSWSAVPEPTSALAGLLLASGLLRRRRK